MNKASVSIITPSFNQGNFIEETINSVLNQTYKNIEFIVIDGGSTDNTLEILKRYDSKIKYISELDKGQTDAINKGFKMASGEIVGWIGSDDLLDPKCIENVVSQFNEDKNIGICYGNIINIDESGNRLNKISNSNINLSRLLNVNSKVVQPGSFYRKCFVKEVGYLDESLRYVMDYDLWIKLLKVSKIKYIDKVLAYFRLHSQSKSVSQTDNFAPEIEKVLIRNNGSLYALPSKYLKENHYEKWLFKVKELIENAFKNCCAKNIGIYGTGTHTLSMLEVYKNIYGSIDFNVFLFDSNKNKWGEKFLDYEIMKPEKINCLNLDRIIISSYSYQEEIYNYINKIINLNIKIIKLYDKEKNCIFFT